MTKKAQQAATAAEEKTEIKQVQPDHVTKLSLQREFNERAAALDYLTKLKKHVADAHVKVKGDRYCVCCKEIPQDQIRTILERFI